MDDKVEAVSGRLQDVFNRGFKLFTELESSCNPSNSKEYQKEVKVIKNSFEEATHMVNQIGVFSQNEDIEEVATADIKYLLLPALLGSLTGKMIDVDRAELLNISEIYFKDFLERCKNYGVTDIVIPESTDSGKDLLPNDLSSMAQRRQEKIAQYKRKKEIESKLEEMKTVIENKNVEDEIKRKYYLLLIKKWVATSLEELTSIYNEKIILKQMPSSDELKENNASEAPVKKTLTPIIITKNELQKKVFGLGYPSIPAMTIDEFYQQRYNNQEQHTPLTSMNSLQNIAHDTNRAAQEAEREIEEKERKEERDDPESLHKDREWDDWKDDHRRGSGNRKNMG